VTARKSTKLFFSSVFWFFGDVTADDGRWTKDDVGSLVVHRPPSIVHFQSSHHERLRTTKG
jgi:hypothetical protein